MLSRKETFLRISLWTNQNFMIHVMMFCVFHRSFQKRLFHFSASRILNPFHELRKKEVTHWFVGPEESRSLNSVSVLFIHIYSYISDFYHLSYIFFHYFLKNTHLSYYVNESSNNSPQQRVVGCTTKVGGQQRPWQFKAFDGTGLKGGAVFCPRHGFLGPEKRGEFKIHRFWGFEQCLENRSKIWWQHFVVFFPGIFLEHEIPNKIVV